MTIRFVCDDPDRLAARLFSRVAGGVDCHCCTFWRGAVVGAALFAIAAGIVVALVRLTAA